MSVSKPTSLKELKAALCSCLPASETVDHLIRYLGTWSGSDKFFMIISYAIKLIVPFLHARARLQHRAGMRSTPTSSSAPSLAKFGGIISDARMLWRIWGLLPIVQWLISLERSPPTTRSLLNIERLQGLSMLFYYPLEHLYYLTSHSIVPTSIRLPRFTLPPFLKPTTVTTVSSPPLEKLSEPLLKVVPDTVSLYSSRFWAAYVFLQFLHLHEDRILLTQRQKQLKRTKTTVTDAEKKEFESRWDAYWSELIVNLGYAPLTIHWSLEGGLFKNDIWVGVLGLIAGVASFRTGWKATELPKPAATEENTDKVEAYVTEGYDASPDA